jgi:DNA polymerase III epsilon subunit family exonuclease
MLMNLDNYTFVALDLETTGLSPEKDTIIEVAAVKFHLTRDGDIWRAADQEERSMLIDPGRKLEENISMITGISDSMLVENPKWDEVRERVETFIWDAIIVGHNVLFDIAMLASHGIDLTWHIALDTFELSEIFSRDAESLNLGFLGKKYEIDMESEHRALDDTKLSIELFLRYLTGISKLSSKYLDLWHHASGRDESGTIRTLLDIVGYEKWFDDFTFWFQEETRDMVDKKIIEMGDELRVTNYELRTLSWDREIELDLIRKSLEKSSPLLILTPNNKQSIYLEWILRSTWYTIWVFKNQSHFFSIGMINYWLNMKIWKRKEAILILKICSTILESGTGLIDELKYYGDERMMIDFFRSEEDENNYFFALYKKSLVANDILIADLYTRSLSKAPLIPWDHSLIVRDVMMIEDIVRRGKSSHISFEGMIEIAGSLSGLGESSIWEDLIMGLSIIGDIYRAVPERPKGETAFPPGDFGETYLITQRALWHRGYRWLLLGAEKLRNAYEGILLLTDVDPIEKKKITSLKKDISLLIHMSRTKDENTSIILSIKLDDTRVSYIPRDVRWDIGNILSTQRGKENKLLGYGIDTIESKRFLEKECGILWPLEWNKWWSTLWITKRLDITWEKTVILTTSTKHIRMLVNELKGKYNIKNIYGQWVSWGKSKMLSLFSNAKEKSVLIGLIDSWIDESDLWEFVDLVIIAKVPFDPPTDPYFLARTVGMKNNFEEYSSPIALSTMNTLIGRIHFANNKCRILCIDERLETMNWWISMRDNLL